MELNHLTAAHSSVVYSAQPRILVSSSNYRQTINPNPQLYYERPMMLNAWTQTTVEDYEFLNEDKAKIAEQLNTEKLLLERIDVLTENLRTYSELFTQIHALSGRKDLIKFQQSPLSQNQAIVSPDYRIASPSSTSVINTAVQPLPTETAVKYTIIADNNGTVNDSGPIEIQLADDDGAINLNNSADSNRLEICLTDENIDNTVESTPKSQTISPFIKRRKINVNTEELKPLTLTNYNAEYNYQTPISSSSSSSSGAENSMRMLVDQETATTSSSDQNDKLNIQATVKKEKSPSGQTSMTDKVVIDKVMVSIGPNNTRIPADIYDNMSWTQPSLSTRKLLMAIFDRQTLATHSMTGKPSPAFKDQKKPLKQMLDPRIIQDIIFAVTHKCNVSEKEVRNAITTKCADENKMMKLQLNKTRTLRENNKENIDQK